VGGAQGHGHPDALKEHSMKSMNKLPSTLLVLVCALPVFASRPALEEGDWLCESCGLMADFDGDGLDDMLDVANRRMLRNLGGVFSAPVPVTGIADHETVRSIGDYDGDGVTDLVLLPTRGAHDEGPNRFAFGNGRGGFTSTGPAFPKEYGVLGQEPPRDFNSDGKLDLVLYRPELRGDRMFATLSFLAGKGDGTFMLDQAITFRGGAYPYMAIADFNRDGRWDLVRTGDHPDSLYLHYSGPDGRLGSARERYVGAYVNRVRSADSNGDSFSDLIVETWDTDSASVLLLFGDASGRFPAYTEMPATSTWSPIVADIFPGGGDELAFTHSNGWLTVYSAVGNELNAVARERIKGASYYRGGLVHFRSATQLDFVVTARDSSRVPNVDRSKIVFVEGELPEAERVKTAVPRRVRAMRPGPVANQYDAIVTGTCVPPALENWSFAREGIFLDFAPNESGTEIAGAIAGGKLAARVTTADRTMTGKLTLTADQLRGYLYNRSEGTCGGRVHVEGARIH
jgi:hypothetical protein